MSVTKRLRIFSGPNGSGKSTLFSEFNKQKFYPIPFVNSDQIEKEITDRGFLDLSSFNLDLNQDDLQLFLQEENAESLVKKAKSEGYDILIKISENIVIDLSERKSSYSAAMISSLVRKHLLLKRISFSFESVMSHSSKLYELKLAKELGYKTYLYFICIDNPEVNISRVKNRVSLGGHSVDEEKIRKRYESTLENLYPAMQLVDKAYLFDNSDQMILIADLDNKELTIRTEKELPNWFLKYIINKK